MTASANRAVPHGLTLLLGGARSGKSSLAVELGAACAASGGDVTFIATATPVDADMSERIRRHRADRPGWPTIESPVALPTAISTAPARHLLIVDCITFWVSNLMYAELDEPEILRRARDAADAARSRTAPVVVVSNEVGFGVHPATELGVRFQDTLGRVNQIWAGAADRSLLLVAGRAVPLVDPWTHFA